MIDGADICVAVIVAGELVLLLPCLHSIPEIVVEDPELWRLLDDPFRFRVGARLPLSGVRVLYEALAVPDDLADIHLIIEDAVATLRVAVDRAETPVAARRGRNAVLVQCKSDGLCRLTGGVVAEDAENDGGLVFVDGAVAANGFAIGVQLLDHIVAIGIAATRFASLDTAALAAAGLVSKIFKEEGIHRALQTDMQMADLAFRQGEHLHIRIGHAFEDAGDVFLITREAIHRLREDHVEPAAHGVGHQGLDARTDQGCS